MSHPIPEIRRTCDVPVEPEGLSDLLTSGLIGEDSGEDWPDERHLLGECVMLEGPRAVGFGRVVWDAHTDEMPRVTDLALAPAYRSAFFIDSLEGELIAEYADEAEGGDMLRGHDGRVIDITRLGRGSGARDTAYGARRPRA